MFLSQSYIKTHLNDLIKGGDPELVQAANYDLRVGDEIYLSEEKVPVRLGPDNRYAVIPPGQFAIVKTLEEVTVPRDMLGLISIRTRFKFQGLVNVSGFHVDPTYRGHLLFGVQNVGPNDVRLEYRDAAFMILWARLESPFTGTRRKGGFDRIPLEYMAQLGGANITLAGMRQKVDALASTVKILIALASSALVGVLILVIRALTNAK